MPHMIPAYARDRYRLIVDRVTPTRAEVGIYTANGKCELAAGADCHPNDVAETIERLVRQADAARDENDPIAIAAQMVGLAAKLATVHKHEGPVVEAFNGDWASVFEHLKIMLVDVVEAVHGGAETAGDMGNDFGSAAWVSASEYADVTVAHLVAAVTTLGLAAGRALEGQHETRGKSA
jgi:hypothetical protein